MNKEQIEMKNIIITKGFDQNQVIGNAQIDIKHFGKDMIFAPGYIEKENGDIELIEISLILDKNYKWK